MHSASDPHPTPPTLLAGAEWLQQHGLALPAWVALECVRPFGWLLGQACLLAQPLGRGLGQDRQLDTLARWLSEPEALGQLSAMLEPKERSP